MANKIVKNLIKMAIATHVIAFTINSGAISAVFSGITDAMSPKVQAFVQDVQKEVNSSGYFSMKGCKEAGMEVAREGEKLADELGCEFERATLVRVVDGDTIVVNIGGEEDVKVRLIGVNTPESVAPKSYLEKKGVTNGEEGKAASNYVKDLLKINDINFVYIQRDKQDKDIYGRELGYVWLEVPKDAHDIREVESKMLNGILLRDGYAEVAIYKPNTMYADYFSAIETGETDLFEKDR